MPWVKVDDHFDEHPKMAAVGPLGWGLWLAGLAYCNRNLTDGFIPRSKAQVLCTFELEQDGVVWTLARTSGMQGVDIESEWVIELLLEAGLWDRVGGGYLVHDYDQFQPLKEDVLREREQKRAAGRAGGQASAQARASRSAKAGGQASAQAEQQAESNPVPVPVPHSSPPTPPKGGSRANGTNPRAAAKQREIDALRSLMQDCSECGDNPNVLCGRCTGLNRKLSELMHA